MEMESRLINEVLSAEGQFKREVGVMKEARALYYGMFGARESYVNLIFSMIETMYGVLMAQNLEISVEGQSSKGRRISKVFESLLRNHLEDVEEAVSEMVLDALQMGTGIMRIGYSTFGMKTGGVQGATVDEERQQDYIWLKAVSPLNFYCNPGARNLKEARFIVEKVLVPTEEIKENVLYRESVRKKVGRTVLEGSGRDEDGWTGFDDEALKRYSLTMLYDVHLKEGNGVRNLVFAEGEREECLYNELTGWSSYPYEMWTPIVDRKSIFGVPYALTVKKIAMAIDDIISSGVRKRKEFPAQLLVDWGLWRDYEKAFESRQSRVMAVKGMENKPIEGGLHLFEPSFLSQDEMVALDFLIREFHRVTGVTMMQMAIAKGATATETSLVQQSAMVRTNPKVRGLYRAIKRILQRIILIYYDKSREFAGVIKDILDDEEQERLWAWYVTMSPEEAATVKTDIIIKLGLEIDIALQQKRNRYAEALRIISLPQVQSAMAAQGKIPPLLPIVEELLDSLGIKEGVQDATNMSGLQQLQPFGGGGSEDNRFKGGAPVSTMPTGIGAGME